MIQFLGILKNPLFKLVADKTMGAINHKLEKDKIIKAKEIDAAKSVSIEQIKQQENSWKDEWITVIFTLLFVGHFIPDFQPHFDRAWQILSSANDYFWIIVLTIVGGSFGTRLLPNKKK